MEKIFSIKIVILISATQLCLSGCFKNRFKDLPEETDNLTKDFLLPYNNNLINPDPIINPDVNVDPPIDTLKSDLKVYPMPPLPNIGIAGSKIIDPTFKTTILRISDSSDGNQECLPLYSYWPSVNINSTRILIICNYSGSYRNVFFNFDPNTLTLSNKSQINVAPQTGGSLYTNDIIWSNIDPYTIFGHNNGNKLWSYNVNDKTYTLIKDFSSEVVSGGGLRQMRKSNDDNVFSFTMVDSAKQVVGYFVWEKSTNEILVKNFNSGHTVDEVGIDKSGKFLVVINTDGDSQTVNLETKTITQFNWGTNGWYHYDVGIGTFFTSANDGSHSFLIRSFLNPFSVLKILPGYFGFTTKDCYHYSSLADNELWALISLCNKPPGQPNGGNDGKVNIQAFDNEIFQVATDGSNRVRRIAHHRSIHNAYNDQPHANISSDGQFVIFGSNWGAKGRRDAFLVKIPQAPLQ